jgi:hypothetical protein
MDEFVWLQKVNKFGHMLMLYYFKATDFVFYDFSQIELQNRGSVNRLYNYLLLVRARESSVNWWVIASPQILTQLIFNI